MEKIPPGGCWKELPSPRCPKEIWAPKGSRIAGRLKGTEGRRIRGGAPRPRPGVPAAAGNSRAGCKCCASPQLLHCSMAPG